MSFLDQLEIEINGMNIRTINPPFHDGVGVFDLVEYIIPFDAPSEEIELVQFFL